MRRAYLCSSVAAQVHCATMAFDTTPDRRVRPAVTKYSDGFSVVCFLSSKGLSRFLAYNNVATITASMSEKMAMIR